jgi:hypothetical protein
MDPVTATILAAVIGAAGSVIGGIIGSRSGYKHSIESFMDVYKKDIQRAVQHLEDRQPDRAKDIARGFVENVKVWRDIQGSFAQLLNGLVNELDGALRTGNDDLASQMIRAINEAYEGKRLAVDTQLRRSRI